MILTSRWPSLSWWNLRDLPMYVLLGYIEQARAITKEPRQRRRR